MGGGRSEHIVFMWIEETNRDKRPMQNLEQNLLQKPVYPYLAKTSQWHPNHWMTSHLESVDENQWEVLSEVSLFIRWEDINLSIRSRWLHKMLHKTLTIYTDNLYLYMMRDPSLLLRCKSIVVKAVSSVIGLISSISRCSHFLLKDGFLRILSSSSLASVNRRIEKYECKVFRSITL